MDLAERTEPHQHDRDDDLRDFTDHTACLVAAPDELADGITERFRTIARTGRAGDGKIFVLDLEQAVRIGSGERGEPALR